MRTNETTQPPQVGQSELTDGLGVVNAEETKDRMPYIGIHFQGDIGHKFWMITCPCGITVDYPVNGLPEVDTPHPCGNEDHWVVKYDTGDANEI